MNEKLQSVLGDDGMVELRALITASALVPIAQPQWQAFLLGLVKSRTAWFAGVMIALPDALPYILPQLQDLLDAQTYARILKISGLVVLLLRVVTNKSIVDKGTKPAPPASP